MVLAQAFDDLHLFLRNDLNPLHQRDDDEEGDAEQDENHARLTSRTMPSAPTTLTRAPASTSDGLRAAQSSPPTLTRPVPRTGSISCVTTPSRPISVSVRPGTPGPCIFLRTIGRKVIKEPISVMVNSTNCNRMPPPNPEATAATTAATATKIRPKCGIEISTIAATIAVASHKSAPKSMVHIGNRGGADYTAARCGKYFSLLSRAVPLPRARARPRHRLTNLSPIRNC